MTTAEVAALRTAMIVIAGFAIFGRLTGSPNTMSYVLTVSAGAALVVALRRRPLPLVLTVGLPLVAVGHLAGGLVSVGDDVLYNAHLWTPVLQFDHLVHSFAVFIGTVALWTLLVHADDSDRRPMILLTVLAGLGLGALNEMIEFLLTMAHQGAHVGGYENTGWDLVANLAGALAAACHLTRTTRDRVHVG